MSVYLSANFQVSSITLTSYRQGEGVILPSPPAPTHTHTPQKESLKGSTRLGLKEVQRKILGNTQNKIV